MPQASAVKYSSIVNISKVSWPLGLSGHMYLPLLLFVVLGVISVIKLYSVPSICDIINDGLLQTEPEGHLKPLGLQSPPNVRSLDYLVDYPSPSIFYNSYIKLSRPVVFKEGVIQDIAFKLWSDDYLKKKYGEIHMSVEFSKKENRAGDIGRLKLGDFLQRYKYDDIYLVDSIPKEMLNEVSVPTFLQCGLLKKHVVDVMIWMSSGQTNSVLHYDAYDNIHCLLEGTKYLYLTDQISISKLDHPEEAFSSVDVEKVDLHKFPELSQISWYNITLNIGDCIFIPYKWVHHVKSSKGRNLSFNIWFSHLNWFNLSECDNYERLPTRFSSFEFASREDELRNELINLLGGPKKLSRRDFMKLFTYYINPNHKRGNLLFDQLDCNRDEEVTIDEMYYVESKTLLYYTEYITQS